MKTIPKHTLDYIDNWLNLRLPWLEIPGISIAIAKKGKVVFKKAYGLANTARNEKLTPDHLFRIASHSKTFTATAIMQLAEKGKLRIDDHVVDYLDWLKPHKDKRWRDVTIRQLLSHSAGVTRDGIKSDYWQVLEPFPDRAELHRQLLKVELVYDPNVKMKYSNFGYSLLGEIIEVVSGVTYNEYVADFIIKPLKLKNTFPDLQDIKNGKLAQGYSRLDLRRESSEIPHVSTNAMVAATGFVSTASDLCVYLSAHKVGSGKLLSDQSKREMQRLQWKVLPEDQREGYGLGIDIVKYDDRRILGHGGGFPGFITRTSLDQEDEYVISVLTNSHDGGAGSLARAVTSIIDGLGEDEPKKSLLKYEGLFVDIGTTFQVLVKGESLISLWPNWNEPFGEIEELEYVNKSTLKIAKTGSYYSEGELIEYGFKAGKVDHILYAGGKMWPSVTGEYPEALWKKKLSKN